MKYVVVLPFAYKPYKEECQATMNPKFAENVHFIDDTNPDNRIGIMRAHNRGIDRMRQLNADWLIILSAAIRFGKPGGIDFLDVLDKHPNHYVIHAASLNVKPGVQQKPEGKDQVNEVKGWHLTAFKREVFDKVGRWDENFTPYGFDDNDLSIRIQKKCKGKKGWDTFPCDVHDMGMAHSINLGGVISLPEPKIENPREKN